MTTLCKGTREGVRAFGLDAAHPDPGRVTLRRLNRVEYRNTIRDLTGVDFKADEEFPPDDTGHGFDNLGDVLTVSPMLLEKYLGAAQAIVTQAVPTVPKVMPERVIAGNRMIDYSVQGRLEALRRKMMEAPLTGTSPSRA